MLYYLSGSGIKIFFYIFVREIRIFLRDLAAGVLIPSIQPGDIPMDGLPD
ncbi:MAG: hypothetical protein BWX87_01476 [Bacteroidetes bacterium ADurb.Bin123]|jgi:hypothetical protein|nr:MAG: hypothetical protein BWX87_01476 [Bacteroidetes bacterium ADurb.Bin123]